MTSSLGHLSVCLTKKNTTLLLHIERGTKKKLPNHSLVKSFRQPECTFSVVQGGEGRVRKTKENTNKFRPHHPPLSLSGDVLEGCSVKGKIRLLLQWEYFRV